MLVTLVQLNRFADTQKIKGTFVIAEDSVIFRKNNNRLNNIVMFLSKTKLK